MSSSSSLSSLDDKTVAEVLADDVANDVNGMAGRCGLEDDGSDDGKPVK